MRIMKVRLKPGLIIVSAETSEERESLAIWAKPMHGHVFALHLQDAQTFRLNDLGPRADACREPINVTSRSPDPAIQLISNFAHTPFDLDGQQYGSVEAFWQGLKYPGEARRREIAPLLLQRQVSPDCAPSSCDARDTERDGIGGIGLADSSWFWSLEPCGGRFGAVYRPVFAFLPRRRADELSEVVTRFT